MNKQLSILDLEIEEKRIKCIELFDLLLDKVKQYGIDDIYEKEFAGNQPVIWTIYNRLSKEDNYIEYIKKVYEILKPYIREEKIDYETDRETTCMEFRDDSIRIMQPHTWYSIFCLKMLDRKALDSE